MSSEERTCRAARPGRGDGPCTGPADFDVVIRYPGGQVLTRTPACYTHGLAEVDRAHAAGGIATASLVEDAAAAQARIRRMLPPA